jgi:hypothetical protein
MFCFFVFSFEKITALPDDMYKPIFMFQTCLKMFMNNLRGGTSNLRWFLEFSWNNLSIHEVKVSTCFVFYSINIVFS